MKSPDAETPSSPDSKSKPVAKPETGRSPVRLIIQSSALLLGVAVLLAAVFWLPQAIAGNETSSTSIDLTNARNSIRSTLVQAFGGLILLVGIFFTLRQIKNGQEQLQVNWAQQKSNQDIGLANLEASRRAQQGETFSRAVDQFGSDSIVARLGGIATLERIARDDIMMHETIVEMLCAFIRAESRSKVDRVKRIPTKNPVQGFAGRPSTRPRADIQLALTAIGRLRPAEIELDDLLATQDRGLLDLDESSLVGANLALTHLQGATFRRADLSEANLSGGSFESVVFYEASCPRANLAGCNLSGSCFDEADLTQTDFQGADLFMATLMEARLTATSFVKADIRGANMSDATKGGPADAPPDFRDAIADQHTIWPDWVDVTASGATVVHTDYSSGE